jgi:hypothetical protein
LDVRVALRPSANGNWTAAPGLRVTSNSLAAGPQAVGIAPDGTAYVQYFYQGPSSGQDCVGAIRAPAGATTAPTSPTPPGPVPPPVLTTKDTIKPTVTLTLPGCAQRLAHAACTLTGKVADNAAGTLRVELGAVLKGKAKATQVLAVAASKLRQMTPAAAARSYVAAKVKAGTWTLKLPKLPKLRKGAWTIRVRAIDAAGNVSRVVTRSIRLE